MQPIHIPVDLEISHLQPGIEINQNPPKPIEGEVVLWILPQNPETKPPIKINQNPPKPIEGEVVLWILPQNPQGNKQINKQKYNPP